MPENQVRLAFASFRYLENVCVGNFGPRLIDEAHILEYK